MISLGLTGCIATGKSTVSAMLAELGAEIVDADKAAKAVVLPGQPGLRAIVDAFGAEFLLPDGNLNRALLGDKIFREPDSRKLLNETLHPLIKQVVAEQITRCRESGAAVTVLDVPLLFETGWQRYTDVNWVVYVDDAVQLARLMVRNSYNEAEARLRIASQMSLANKVKLADVVIDNSKNLQHTRLQVEAAWQQLGDGCQIRNKYGWSGKIGCC